MQLFESDHSPSPAIGDIIDSFFPPAQFDSLSLLVGEFERTKQRIEEVHALISEERVSGVLSYFFSGNGKDRYGHCSTLRHTSSVDEVFRLEGALNDLTATYWHRALGYTNLLDEMPQERRNQWHECLNAWREPGYKRGAKPELDMPEFNDANLRATLQGLTARRAEFVAERVDGIFRNLSGAHVTNTPEGFNKRMIMAGIYDSFGCANHSRAGYIHDLRAVIAKFMGRDEPDRSTTTALLEAARAHRGEWIEVDCGSLRLKGFAVGTAHLDVHPDMAWRLNAILAYLYPAAIPDANRRPPKRTKASRLKEAALFDRPISNAAAGVLANMERFYTLSPSKSFRRDYEREYVPNSLSLRYGQAAPSKHLLAEVDAIMAALGGVKVYGGKLKNMPYWQFEFEPSGVVREVALSGKIPDAKAHQFYPTPTELAQRLVDWLDITTSDTFCEPQAGQGGIADLLPKDRTLCVEVSPLHCQILREKGHTVIEGDFLAWNPGTRFSVIAMNPPFSEGRWEAHLAKAGTLVELGGRLGAILPLSARHRAAELLPGFELEFSAPVDNAFAGTSISVQMLRAVRRVAA